jgi:hypothetical protein
VIVRTTESVDTKQNTEDDVESIFARRKFIEMWNTIIWMTSEGQHNIRLSSGDCIVVVHNEVESKAFIFLIKMNADSRI